MLKKLLIQNYAIIDEITIDFSSQLNMITGETGAGKSILMGALSLILGERADSGVLLHKEKKCFIEGNFAVDGKKDVLHFLQEQDLDAEPELVIRREIAANGKSRAFINDTPATLQQLKALTSLLVDLHQQFDTLELGDTDFQREVLDALADHETVLTNYKEAFRQWQTHTKAWEQLQEQKRAFAKEADYNRFLFDELNELSLKENELEDIDQELKLLSHSEGIKTALSKLTHDLKESEQPVVVVLKQLINQVQAYAHYHPGITAIIERLQSSQVELQDIANEAEHINDAVGYDPQRIEWINQRLADGYKLLKKHGVQTTQELLQLQAELDTRLQAVLHIDDAIDEKEKAVAQWYQLTQQQAAVISKARRQQVKPLEDKVNRLLVQVGMPNARLKITVEQATLQASGMDRVEFLFDANKSGRFEPVRKVASGGELSRLMLCIKSLVAQSINLPTMIFDEIDTGISGEAARQVGLIMKDLSAKRQIICITHQPQIAGKAHAHFYVYKESVNDTVKTHIRLLNPDERITAIAQMLSGEKPTAAALENAREMIAKS